MSNKIEYVCADCGASGVRLWREYSTFLNHQHLRCRSCAVLNQTHRASDCWSSEPFGDQIGWLVPAVPTVEMDTYWGYSSVPQDRVDWWNALPVVPPMPHPDIHIAVSPEAIEEVLSQDFPETPSKLTCAEVRAEQARIINAHLALDAEEDALEARCLHDETATQPAFVEGSWDEVMVCAACGTYVGGKDVQFA